MKLNLEVSIAVLLLASSQALSQSGTPAPTKTLKFLTPAEVDPSRLLPPPPEDGSEFQTKELAQVERMVTIRASRRLDRAVWDNDHEDPTAFAGVLGPDFDLEKLPATRKLFAEVQNEQSVAASMAKVYFHRKFPVAAAAVADDSYRKWSCDADVKKPTDRPLRSYPSGHATMGYTFGIVLAALMSEKAQAILARAADYAYSREVCGDHYHSDVEASHALGTAVAIMLLNNAALKPDLEAAKMELNSVKLATHQ